MANIIDYVIWRGDLPFYKSKINEIDKIIFTRFAYLPFKEIEMNETETIGSLMVKFENVDESKFIWSEDVRLIKLLGTSTRFKDIVVSDYEEILDVSLEKQFAAITLWILKNEKFISFRGTDTSVVGWKEDLNMTYKSNIPSQLEGVNYLNKVGKKYINSDLIIGGHSKGGNISIYASIFADDLVRLNIKEIISADGPGFSSNILNDPKFEEIKHKIKTYMPQLSIVGRILDYTRDRTVVKSNAKVFMQHDIYSWEVNPLSFVQVKDITKESNMISTLFRDIVEKTNPEDREKFINIIYEILVDSNINSFDDLPKNILSNANRVLTTYKNISDEDKLQVENMINQIKKFVTDIIKEDIKEQNRIKEEQKEKQRQEKLRIKQEKKAMKEIEKQLEKENKKKKRE